MYRYYTLQENLTIFSRNSSNLPFLSQILFQSEIIILFILIEKNSDAQEEHEEKDLNLIMKNLE